LNGDHAEGQDRSDLVERSSTGPFNDLGLWMDMTVSLCVELDPERSTSCRFREIAVSDPRSVV